MLATAICTAVFEPPFPQNAVLVTPPPQYRVWWDVVERCSGHTTSFDAVFWYRVPIGAGLTVRGESAAGAWFAEENSIAIGDGWRLDGSLVRHEMLHAILPTGSHPKEYFQDACRDEVLCGRDCVEDVVLPNAIPLSVAQLDVDATLFPRSLSLGRNDGYAVVVVRVRNPYGVNAFVNARHFERATCSVGFVMTSLSDSRRSDQVSVPLGGYAVKQSLGESAGWVASVANAGHPKDVCLVARESGRVWSLRDKFVWQAYASRGPRRWTRVEVYGDSTLIEDRDPERREEQWGAVVLSDSIYKQLSRYQTLNIKVKAPYRPASVTISLSGFNQLKNVFDSPACTGR